MGALTMENINAGENEKGFLPAPQVLAAEFKELSAFVLSSDKNNNCANMSCIKIKTIYQNIKGKQNRVNGEKI